MRQEQRVIRERVQVSWAQDIPGREPMWYVLYTRRGLYGEFHTDNVCPEWGLTFPDLTDLGPFDGDVVVKRLRRAFPRATVEVER